MKLKVNDLCFSYSKKNTIENINFEVNSGDIVAILGVNGVGKSTMLKCLNNIHKPTSGEILIDDKPISKMKSSEIAQLIGYVPQENQFVEGTVFDNVLIGRKPFIKWNLKDKDLIEVSNAINLVGLDELSNRKIDNLSGGERQKVAICKVLAQKTPILLFDEPTSNLDIKNQLECLDIIKKIVNENQLIALISIHDINLALRYANKFLLLKEGKVYKFGDSNIINEESIKEIYGVDSEIKIQNNRKVLVLR